MAEPNPPPSNVHANVALLSAYVDTEYEATVQEARSLTTRAAGLLAANAGALTIAATIAPSARDSGGAGRTFAWVAAALAVVSILIAILRALPRPTRFVSIRSLGDLLTAESLEQDPLRLSGSLVTGRTQEIAYLREANTRANGGLRIATLFLVVTLMALAGTVGLVVIEPSRPAATHVVVDSPVVVNTARQARHGHRREGLGHGCARRGARRHLCDNRW